MLDKHKSPCFKDGAGDLRFGHLGGTTTGGDDDSWLPELMDWLVGMWEVKTAFDVGCGVGYMQRYLQNLGVRCFGLDCPQVLAHHVSKTDIFAHDLTDNHFLLPEGPADLVLSIEVGEHIDGHFQPNYLKTLVDNCGKVLAFSAAPPGAGGHHHVFCQPPDYWICIFESLGLKYNAGFTDYAKSLCGPTRTRTAGNYFLRSGLVFTKH